MTSHQMKNCLNCGAPIGHIKVNRNRRKFCNFACDRAHVRSRGPERFWEKVDKNGPGGCWLYTGFKKWDGYGWLARSTGDNKYRYLTAHRYAWILTHGFEPEKGLHIMHKC